MQPVFVGDVQGCADELESMLGWARRRFADDFELWLVGDLINRGPANRAVLARVRGLVESGRARVVLGNHDLAFLGACLGVRELRFSDTLDELLSAPDRDAWFEWLRSLPLVETGTLGERRFAMVHASVHPDWTLPELVAHARAAEARLAQSSREELTRWLAASGSADADRDTLGRLTSGRSVFEDGRWSREEPAPPSVPWHEAWKERAHDYGVVYGHWSMQGLHVAGGLRGLDTGCVHHGRDHEGFLTAWFPDVAAGDPFVVPDDRFWQVRARARYYREPDGGAE